MKGSDKLVTQRISHYFSLELEAVSLVSQVTHNFLKTLYNKLISTKQEISFLVTLINQSLSSGTLNNC